MTTTTHDLTMLALGLLLDLETSEGVITPEMEARLDDLEGEAPDKLDALRWVAEQARAEAAHLKAEAARLRDSAQARLNLVQRLKDRAGELLSAYGDLHGEAKIKSQTHSFWMARTVSVQGPEDVKDWPAAYRREVVTVKIDRTLAKRALQDGEVLDGVFLVESTSIRWR